MKKKIAIIGLGYVGLPLLLLINKKFDILDFDKDKNKIKLLNKNISYISDVKKNELKKINKNSFNTTDEYKKIRFCDYIIICLPTPLNKKNEPDMSYIKECFKSIKKYLKKNQTIILESSVYTGATKEIFEKELKKKYNLGKNFYLCYSPERIDPGKEVITKKTEYKKITKLISGYSKNCLKKIKKLYSSIFNSIYECETIEIAETAKLLENIYRSVNIGLVDEMKTITERLNINIHKVIDAAGTKPFGYRKFSPGPGVGGHCIPIDPVFMSWIAKKKGIKSRFIDLSVAANLKITNWTLNKIQKFLKSKKEHKALIIGITYKKDVNDLRESPSLKIFRSLLKSKYKIQFSDPYVKNLKIFKNIYKSVTEKEFHKYQVAIILTDHSSFNYDNILKKFKFIIDSRGVFKNNLNKKIIHI